MASAIGIAIDAATAPIFTYLYSFTYLKVFIPPSTSALSSVAKIIRLVLKGLGKWHVPIVC
jgi:hypothetical protein